MGFRCSRGFLEALASVVDGEVMMLERRSDTAAARRDDSVAGKVVGLEMLRCCLSRAVTLLHYLEGGFVCLELSLSSCGRCSEARFGRDTHRMFDGQSGSWSLQFLRLGWGSSWAFGSM